MKRTIHIILALSLIFTSISCGEKNGESSPSEIDSKEVADDLIQITQAQFEQSKMVLGKLEEKPFPTIVNVNGMIDVPPENRAVVTATMGGYIKTTPLLIGDKVRKGQILVTIENPEFVTIQQQYMEIGEQLTYLKAEYDRQLTMRAENITSQKSFLKAESDYKTAVAKHTGLERRLQMLNISPSRVREGVISSVVSIFAPISGSITKLNVTKGSYVSPSSEILEIIDNDHIHLELSVFEKDIMKVRKGQLINFNVPEASEETFKASVYLVGTALQENRTIKVHAHLENEEDNNFLTGMFVKAAIATESKVAKALPDEAIVKVDDRPRVLVLEKKEDEVYYFRSTEVNILGVYDGYSMLEDPETFDTDTIFLTKGAFALLGE